MPAAVAPWDMTTRRKTILSVQVALALLVIAATVWALTGQGGGTPAVQSGSSAGAIPSGTSSDGAASTREDATTSGVRGIPRKLGAVTLIDVLTGQEAIEDMSMLHGKDVGLVGGWVGHYQARGIVFVGEIADEKGAARLLDAMVARISAGNRVFTNLRSTEIDGQRLHSVTGQGQKHYFYQKGNKVIWLSLPTSKPEDFLSEALQVVN